MKNKKNSIDLFNYFISILFLIFFAGFFICCNLSTNEILNRKDTSSLKGLKILWLIRNDGTTVIFDDNGGSYINEQEYNYDYIVGTNRAGKTIEIKTGDVYQIQIFKDKTSDYTIWILIGSFLMTLFILF